MTIKSITTKFVSENPFSGLTETETPFEPYYACKIVTDAGNANGKGKTEYDAEQDAIENLRRTVSAKVATALEDYNVRVGAGNLDIA